MATAAMRIVAMETGHMTRLEHSNSNCVRETQYYIILYQR